MKIERLALKDFTAFGDTALDFSPGINVLIGANATGKSHVLKALYAIQKTWDNVYRENSPSPHPGMDLSSRLLLKLSAVFKPEDEALQRLVRKPAASAQLKVRTDGGAFTVEILSSPPPVTNESVPPRRAPAPCIFVPSREVLSMYEGFAAAYQHRELSFDETYYDLCIALSANPLKGKAAAWGARILKDLEQVLEGSVKLKGRRFYVGDLEAQLVAEGHRKLASVVQLLRNGALSAETTLYWDEPEAGLNPRLIKTSAEVLVKLATAGVQVFVASHDFLLTSELSLAAEYKKPDSPPTRFFALHRPAPTSAVEVEWGETLSDLRHNPILEEFAAHYDREQRLFAGDGVVAACRM